MDKQELLGQLNSIKNDYYLTLLAVYLFRHEDIRMFIKEAKINVQNDDKNETLPISFNKVAIQFGDEIFRKKAILQFEIMGLRAFIRETFEVIKKYCKDTSQFIV